MKINRYFIRKFEKIQEQGKIFIEKCPEDEFNYEARLKSFDYKIKKLKKALKNIEGEEENFSFSKQNQKSFSKMIN